MEAGNRVVPAVAGAKQTEFGVINLLKAIAAQLIVLHHLAFYGPMADHARPLAPDLIDWLADDARIAVQVFLVIGGFLAAKSLSPQGQPGLANPLMTIWRRYLKLAPPFFVAMLLAVSASALASTWMTHDSISAPPTIAQLGAHAFLLHDVLGHESLSAGAWYVAIDFQLYAVMSLLLWFCGRFGGDQTTPRLMPIVMTVAIGVSLLYFNLDSDWDVWAPYFLGSYALGVLAWWASDPLRRPRSVALLLLMMALPTLTALMLDFRSRIALALAVACMLILFGRARTSSVSHRGWGFVGSIGKISYSVFLVHFPICLIVNAAFTRFVPDEAHLQAAGTVFAWTASLIGGAGFFRWVELPLGRTLTRFSVRGGHGGRRAEMAS
jgi:peptidoglycan/LPS O-acetylase OafA/YrhL